MSSWAGKRGGRNSLYTNGNGYLTEDLDFEQPFIMDRNAAVGEPVIYHLNPDILQPERLLM
jgi:hypothetical protein